MGQAIKLKKARKYARNEAEITYQRFLKDFDFYKDCLKPCPKLVPKIFWNFLIWLVIKHK
jgi:hypothetical protein